jgi:hypothetical protein
MVAGALADDRAAALFAGWVAPEAGPRRPDFGLGYIQEM